MCLGSINGGRHSKCNISNIHISYIMRKKLNKLLKCIHSLFFHIFFPSRVLFLQRLSDQILLTIFFFFTWKGKKTNKQTVRWWLIRVNMIRVVMSCEQSWRAASVGGEVERRTLADDTAGVVEYLREDTSMVHVSAPNSLDTVHETVRLMVGTTVILCVTLPLRKGLSSSWRTKSSTVHLPFLSTVFFFFFLQQHTFSRIFPQILTNNNNNKTCRPLN